MTETDTVTDLDTETTAGAVAAAGDSAPAKDVQPERGKGDDLDALLAEFDAGPKPKADPAVADKATGGDAQPVDQNELKRLAAVAQRWEAEQTEREIQSTVATVKGAAEELADYPDSWVRARLESEVAGNPKLRDAWIGRNANPAAWNRVLEAVAARLGSEVASRGSTRHVQDQQVAAAAVRGRSTTSPEAPKFDAGKVKSMSIAELDAYTRGLKANARG